MADLVRKYHAIQDDVVAIAKNYQDDEQTQIFIEHVSDKLNNFNPTMMIYGVYNAGKSTLLNAIFGKNELAKTGDAPETAEVRAYSYNGYTIYDTPGINAPLEHQKVTDEHLSKCELILFVLSNNGAFEEKYIYEKIGEVIQLKKPILIVINNKSGIDMNSTEAQNEMDKVNQHLITICETMGIEKAEEKVNVAFVDAKTALEGKIEQEQELIDESKIEHLEAMMNQLLGQSGKNEVSHALNLFIAKYINDTLTIIDSQIDNPEMKKTQELITYLEKLKQRTLIELRNMAMETTVVAAASLLELMLSRDKKSLDDMVRKTVQDVNQNIQRIMTEIQAEVQCKIDQFKIEFEQISIQTPSLTIDSELDDISMTSGHIQHNKGTLATVGTGIATVIPPTIIIPTPIGPIPVKGLVMVASMLFGAFSSSNEARINAEAKMDAKRMQHLGAKNRSDEFALKLKDDFIQNINNNVNQSFTDVIQNFIDIANQLDIKNTQLLEDKRKLEGILHTL